MPRRAILLPGAAFGPHTPTLAYPRFAAERRGAEILALEWHEAEARAVATTDRAQWVADRLAPHLDDETLLIGRSLGTYAAGIAADRALPAIWINPVLTDAGVVAALRRASAPTLLIGGSADPVWDSALARELSVDTVEIEGADHGMLRPGSLRASTNALGELVTAVERFLDVRVWPA